MHVPSSHARGLTPDGSPTARPVRAPSLGESLHRGAFTGRFGHARGLTPDMAVGDA
jgi:hypothetical protein